MNLVRCRNGHFYDEDRFNSCPHCSPQQSASDVTVAVNQDSDVTVALTNGDFTNMPTVAGGSLATEVMKATTGGAGITQVTDDSVTMSFYGKTMETEPVVGWLLCVEGKHLGQDFHLNTGANFIGRSKEMDIAITDDNSVSRSKHAVVVYEPKGHVFLVKAGDSKELCYLNDNLVLSAQELKVNDVITVGSTKLMFFPACSATFNWNTINKED